VFAGTSSALANFYQEPPEETNSRDPNSNEYHEDGTGLYEPFFDICTIGRLRKKLNVIGDSDYEKAIPYGRPLFALLHEKRQLEGDSEFAILQRMLLSLGGGKWENSMPALLSNLATRVQMGQTSSSIVSTLVSSGYANLTSFQRSNLNDGDNEDLHEVANFCYFTDPVCSRLAMCLMDRNWKSKVDPSYKGQRPEFWAKAAFDLFANGLCRPNERDLGEIAVALYFLFCADTVRNEDSGSPDFGYDTFGLPFQEWFDSLGKEPRKPIEPDGSKNRRSLRVPARKKAQADAKWDGWSVSFMQFQRLYLRLPFPEMFRGTFLEDLYLSGTACFLYSAACIFDFVASIKQSNRTYRALLIGVKAHHTFRASDVEKEFENFEIRSRWSTILYVCWYLSVWKIQGKMQCRQIRTTGCW
jgi:hypothetical protein